MAGIPTFPSTLGAFGTSLGFAAMGGAALGSVFLPKYRAIGGMIADAVIEERHHDELVITDHPVQQGSVISDHAYKLPSEIRLTFGWSNSTVAAFGDIDYLNRLYQKLLQMQSDRQLIEVFTGKRQYKNMLLRSISVTTDKDSENILMVRASCREIILAQVSATSVVPDMVVMKNPSATADVSNQGSKSLRGPL